MSMVHFYNELGGELSLRKLVKVFYELMDTLSEAKEIRALHPTNLTSAEEKLFLFLSGWMGGPSLYIEKYGHPRLRARHLPFPIGALERDQWMLCMRKAMEQVNVPISIRAELDSNFEQLATHMINQMQGPVGPGGLKSRVA